MESVLNAMSREANRFTANHFLAPSTARNVRPFGRETAAMTLEELEPQVTERERITNRAVALGAPRAPDIPEEIRGRDTFKRAFPPAAGPTATAHSRFGQGAQQHAQSTSLESFMTDFVFF